MSRPGGAEFQANGHYPRCDVSHAQVAELYGGCRQACAAKGRMGGPSPR